MKTNHGATLTIARNTPSTLYDRRIFGGFLEHFGRQIYGGVYSPESPLSDVNGFRTDALEALRELGTPVVRWPGGCYVSGYHWKHGVGMTRTPTDDMAWGVVEPNTFGTDEFIALCRKLGWEPYICNNAGNGTIEEMAAWVEYCNSEAGTNADLRRRSGHLNPHNVDLWSIGNENWGEHEIGNKPVEEWALLVAMAAKAMRDVDPGIQISAASLPTEEWALPMLEDAGEHLDYISIHGYWLPLWQENLVPDYLSCIMHSEAPGDLIAREVSLLAASGRRGKIKIAFDEWNLRGWHHPGFPRKEVQDYGDPEIIKLIKARDRNLIASQYTMADALFSASFLNACLRNADDVAMANIAPLVNTRGPLHVHPDGVVRRTHFHTMAMYANLLEDHVMDTEVSAGSLEHNGASVSVLDAIATINGDGGTMAVAMVNRHPTDAITCRMVMSGRAISGRFNATVLEGDCAEAFNSVDQPDRVQPQAVEVECDDDGISLPPHSLTILDLPAPRD